MKNVVKRWINEINIIPCKVCGGRDFRDNCVDKMDYIELEKETICNKCGHIVNYWVTGYYSNPWYFTELFKMPLSKIIDFFRYGR